MAQGQTPQAQQTTQQPVNPTTQPSAEMQPVDTQESVSIWRKWWFWLIIVLVILGIGAGVYFLFLR